MNRIDPKIEPRGTPLFKGIKLVWTIPVDCLTAANILDKIYQYTVKEKKSLWQIKEADDDDLLRIPCVLYIMHSFKQSHTDWFAIWPICYKLLICYRYKDSKIFDNVNINDNYKNGNVLKNQPVY